MARLSSPLGGAGILLLSLWLNGCRAVWRYKTSVGYYYIFSTRTTIYLEYEGTFFVEWDIPLLCTVANKTSPTTTLRCPVPGTYKVKPVVTRQTFEDMERYLSILADVNCFLWYVYLYNEVDDSSNSEDFIDYQDIITWVIDPENADASELNYTATSPSPYSEVISKQFWNLGQKPVVKTFFHHAQYTAVAFPEQGLWKIQVPAEIEDMIARIYGSPITFQDCFIADTPLVLTYSPITFRSDYTLSITSPPGSNIMVLWSECFPTSAVLVTDFGTFYTNDGFRTSKEIKFPSSVIDPALLHSVKEVAVFFDYFMILIGDVIYMVDEYLVSKLGAFMDLPDSGIIGLRSRTWCPSEYPELMSISDIITWTKDTVYIHSRNHWYILLTNTTLLKAALKFPPTADLSILKVCFDSLPNEIALLIECSGCGPTRVLYLAAVDELTDTWMLRDFSLPASEFGVLNMEVLYSASTSMMLWDNDKVYYTYEGNKISGYLKVSGTGAVFSAASEGSTIHQLVIDHNGNTIVKLKNNAMFFLKFEMTHAIKLAAWEDETTSFAFYWIIAGTVYLVTVDSHNISRQNYPLKTEVSSAVFKSQEDCPYRLFQHNIQSNAYFVDKGQNVTFWTQIVFLENLGLSTEILVHRPELLKPIKDSHYEIARGICTKYQTTTFFLDQDYSNYSDPLDYYTAISKSTGIMTIEIKPSSSGSKCASNKKVFHIKVGCPSFKNLRIERPPSCEDQNFTFIVPQIHTRFKTGEDLKIEYDKKMYGCPIDAYYGEPFRPVVMLYDADTFVSIVETEYALWEINGRTDFYYNASMSEAHCLRYAQNWHNMGHSEEDAHLTFEEIDEMWGPHNYQSCYKLEQGHLRNIHEPYEILNHSGINSITWPQHYTAVYLFRLRILDPNFSFCDMSELFAVRTYGITESPSGLKVAGFSVSIVILFLGVLVFSYFRYVKIFRTLSFVDPLLITQPSPSDSADELKKEE